MQTVWFSFNLFKKKKSSSRMKQKSYKFLNMLWVIWEIYPSVDFNHQKFMQRWFKKEKETSKHLQKAQLWSQTLALHIVSFISSKNSEAVLCTRGTENKSYKISTFISLWVWWRKHIINKKTNKIVTDRINAIKKRK